MGEVISEAGESIGDESAEDGERIGDVSPSVGGEMATVRDAFGGERMERGGSIIGEAPGGEATNALEALNGDDGDGEEAAAAAAVVPFFGEAAGELPGLVHRPTPAGPGDASSYDDFGLV